MNRRESVEVSEDDVLAGARHCVPVGQPNRVHEVADRVLSAYEVLGGRAHLAGCTLDEVPVVRIETAGDETAGDAPRDYIFGQAGREGRLVDAELGAELGLGKLTECQPPPSIAPAEIKRMVSLARTAAGFSEGVGTSATVIWCKYARGKVQFTISDAVNQQAFAGWARGLQPPKYRCDVTGTETYRVAVTSDGRIVAADQLDCCEVTSQRLPRSELVRCAASGRLVSAEIVVQCAVSGEAVLESELEACRVCQQPLSPNALDDGRCQACRRLTTVRLDDPRLVQALARFPQLTRWRWLRLAESEAIYVVVASGLIEQRLIVVDKISGKLLHAARKSRMTSDWTALSEADLVASF